MYVQCHTIVYCTVHMIVYVHRHGMYIYELHCLVLFGTKQEYLLCIVYVHRHGITYI